MKTIHFFTLIAFLSLMVSCGEKHATPDLPPLTSGTYILNNGNWKGNDANIGIYDPASKRFSPSAFRNANTGYLLGDLAQDIIFHGNRLYISINGSDAIWRTDSGLRAETLIIAPGAFGRMSPRTFASDGTKLYVTYDEGYVGEVTSGEVRPSEAGLDTDKAIITEKVCKVGSNPDGIAVAGEELYVANSGGLSYPDYDNTVSVVSVASFEEISRIEVNVNPIKVEASSDGRYVYVSSFGNYADIPSKLQIIDTATEEVTDLTYRHVISIAKGENDILYILCGGYDEKWNLLSGTIYKHDMKKNLPLGSFVTDGTALSAAYSISAARDGYIYVGCSDYKTNGDVYVFTPDGRLHDKFDSQGLNPLKAY